MRAGIQTARAFLLTWLVTSALRHATPIQESDLVSTRSSPTRRTHRPTRHSAITMVSFMGYSAPASRCPCTARRMLRRLRPRHATAAPGAERSGHGSTGQSLGIGCVPTPGAGGCVHRPRWSRKSRTKAGRSVMMPSTPTSRSRRMSATVLMVHTCTASPRV